MSNHILRIVKCSTAQDNIHVIIDHANTSKPNVRQAVANEQSIKGLVAPQVLKYISEQFLYKEYEREIECSHIALQSEYHLFYLLLFKLRTSMNQVFFLKKGWEEYNDAEQ